jgi:hypothetical protein
MSLPYEEQQLWKKYNIYPSNLPESQLFLSVMNELNWNARATSPDFHFRDCFNELQEKWEDRFGWVLFKPTTGLQHDIINRLVILGSDNSTNFSNLIVDMNLVLTESINVKELKKTGVNFTKESKSIKKLTEFLSYSKIEANNFTTFILNLNTLRTKFTSAHRIDSGEKQDLEKAMSYIGMKVNENNYKESSVNLFSLASKAFEELITLI